MRYWQINNFVFKACKLHTALHRFGEMMETDRYGHSIFVRERAGVNLYVQSVPKGIWDLSTKLNSWDVVRRLHNDA